MEGGVSGRGEQQRHDVKCGVEEVQAVGEKSLGGEVVAGRDGSGGLWWEHQEPVVGVGGHVERRKGGSCRWIAGWEGGGGGL